MQALTVALAQCDLAWEQPDLNRRRIADWLADAAPRADVLLLPEMFTTGFTMRAEAFAEAPDGPTADWLRAQAQRMNALVGGSYIVAEGGRYYNRFALAEPSGRIHPYDKRRLFRMAGEHEHYAAGTGNITVHWRGWRLRPFVCYDLRFPELSLNNLRDAPDGGYDLALYVANWPERRAHHWRRLLRARAIENQCYVAAVNRVGEDAKGTEHAGDSMMIDWNGDALLSLRGGPAVAAFTLDGAALAQYREKFPAWMDGGAA